jgi:uncharacterized membrane protein
MTWLVVGLVTFLGIHPVSIVAPGWRGSMAARLGALRLGDVLLFGGFLAWAVLDRISVGKRAVRELPGAPPGRYNDAILVVLGLAIYGLFAGWAHLHLFGAAPLP